MAKKISYCADVVFVVQIIYTWHSEQQRRETNSEYISILLPVSLKKHLGRNSENVNKQAELEMLVGE